MDAFDILVIILSTFLAIFLVLGIIVTVILIQIFTKIKVIVDKAETAAEKVEHVAEFFQKSAGPAAVGRLIINFAETFNKRKRGKREDNHDE